MEADNITIAHMLTAAAEAAGIGLVRNRLDDPKCNDFLLTKRSDDGTAIGWNPLTSNGDAWHLAATLGMTLETNARGTSIASSNCGTYQVSIRHSTNKYESMRLAVVLLAAKIADTTKE